jgi:hypothetical protein
MTMRVDKPIFATEDDEYYLSLLPQEPIFSDIAWNYYWNCRKQAQPPIQAAETVLLACLPQEMRDMRKAQKAT